MNLKSEFDSGRRETRKIHDAKKWDYPYHELKRRARTFKNFSNDNLLDMASRAYWLGRLRGHGDIRREEKGKLQNEK